MTEIKKCNYCGSKYEGMGNSSYFLKKDKMIKVCDNCNQKELMKRIEFINTRK